MLNEDYTLYKHENDCHISIHCNPGNQTNTIKRTVGAKSSSHVTPINNITPYTTKETFNSVIGLEWWQIYNEYT